MPHEIHDPRPKFECVSCHTRFWVPYPECVGQTEIIAFPITWLQQGETTAEQKEAPAPLGLPSQSELKKLWDKVIAHYSDQESHNEFLRMAQMTGELLFASQQYQKMLQLNGDDDIARQMLERVVALTTVPGPRTNINIWYSLRHQLGISGLLILASVVMMLAGWLLPLLRNLVGVGAALFFLMLTIRIYLRR